MTGIEAALLAFLVLFILLAIRVPIGVAMIVVGTVAYGLWAGWTPALAYLKSAPYQKFSTHSFSIVPLFLLMGHFAARAGLTRILFDAGNTWIGHRRGGVAMAAIAACGGFGAIAGSSLATAATMGQVALPELRKQGYSGALATGALAAGGTLGILIPPSIILVIYAILTEQNVAKMFMAAMIPGILAMLGYMLAVAVYVRLFPGAGPSVGRRGARERLRSLARVWPVLMIFLIVIGGIYTGIFTPTEAAAVGAFITGVTAVVQGGMRLQGLTECVLATALSTGMIFLIVLGADLFNAFLALTRTPHLAADLIAGLSVSPLMVLAAMLLLYFLLGCVMDSLSMILLTIPIFFPIIMGLDFGLSPEETAIWFGILALIVVEVGLITPPIGLNVYIINAMAGDVPMMETFKGVLPFLLSDGIRVIILIFFPVLTLGLVRVMF